MTSEMEDFIFPSRFMRHQMILANTLFKCVCYHPDEHQLITSGTDRKVSDYVEAKGNIFR